MEYYIYAYLRKDGTPYYIGKGKGRRARQEHQVNGRRAKTPTDESRIILLHENLDEQTAIDLEIKLIQEYGRKDLGTGILRNLTSGGEGTSNTSPETNWLKGTAARGKPFSEEARKKISEANKKRSYPNNHTNEVRKKLSETTKKSWEKRSRSLTEEQKQKIRDGMKKKWQERKQSMAPSQRLV
jgi:hypothetical protein